MKSIRTKRFGKVVEVGQTSLSVPMKNEIMELGLSKGDCVCITSTTDKKIIIERCTNERV